MDAPNRYPLPPVLTAAAVVVALVLQWLVPVSWRGAAFWGVLGVVLLLVGAALMVWAVATMGRARANVMPHRAATALVRHGPFGLSRNPIYVADILVVVGLALVFGNAWMLAAAAVLALLLREFAVKREERHMGEMFAGAWSDYARDVRRWL